jgi:hypothetical protein
VTNAIRAHQSIDGFNCYDSLAREVVTDELVRHAGLFGKALTGASLFCLTLVELALGEVSPEDLLEPKVTHWLEILTGVSVF